MISYWNGKGYTANGCHCTRTCWAIRSGSRIKHTQPREIAAFERVHTAKLLGICFSDNQSFAAHIDNTLSAVSQRFYLLKQLKIKGLNQAALDIVFQSLVLNKITYAVQSYLVTSRNNSLTDSSRLCSTKLRNGVSFQSYKFPRNFGKSKLPAFQPNSHRSWTPS